MNNWERKKREQGTYKLTKDHIKFIELTIKENNNIHMSELHKKVKDKFLKTWIFHVNIYMIF